MSRDEQDETFRAVLLSYARAKVRYWHMCFKIRLMRISLLAMGVVEGFFVRQYTVEATGQVPKKKRHPLLQVEDDEVHEVSFDPHVFRRQFATGLCLFLLRVYLPVSQSNKDDTLRNCCGRGMTRTVAFLLRRGARANVHNARGVTPLNMAAQNGRAAVARLLLSDPALRVDVNKPTPAGRTPLYIACGRGHLDVVRVLLAAGARVNQPTANCRVTPLFRAITSHADDAGCERRRRRPPMSLSLRRASCCEAMGPHLLVRSLLTFVFRLGWQQLCKRSG